jgi:YidC/Oxa1 family membrane protein insertase
MEEKKFDINSIIGFILLFGIMIWYFYQNQPTPEELEAQKQAEIEKVETENKTKLEKEALTTAVTTAEDYSNVSSNDSLQQIALQNKLGAFAYASSLPSATNTTTDIETDVLSLKFNNKGGHLSEVRLKEFVDYKGDPIYLIKDGNTNFNINFATTDNRILNTENLFFQPVVSKSGKNTIVSMRLKVSESRFLEYRYELKPNDYMIDFSIKSQGLETVINSSQEINLDWKLKGYRQSKSISYENRYTRLTYQHDDGDKIDKLAQMSDDEEVEANVNWLSYRQHYFSSILVPNEPFKTVSMSSQDLVQDEEVDTVYTKLYASKMPLTISGGNINKSMGLYYGPTDSKILKTYEKGLEKSIPFGWGIFGWINKMIFIPLFGFLSGFLPYGIAIIVMTILVKIVLSFVQYKQFLSQAKMKILKPELDAVRAKYKDNKLKAQQETMAIQSKAGASPLSGCLPGLLQIPVFYALFMFFPTAFDLRQKSFLWAEDLSSFDSIYDFPSGFSIPFYGDHVSLFPILAAIAIFFYMKMTTGQQMATQPTQEGMPDMGKMMKYMIYFSPLLMLVFFNNYASGLSLYYFISNLISIGIMLVIKNYIIDEEKVLAKIQVSKSKPKKQNRFQKKMATMMEQAEEQKQLQQRNKKK